MTAKNSTQEAAAEPENAGALDAARFSGNMQKIAARSQEILELYLSSQQTPKNTLEDTSHINTAFMALFEKMLSNPAKWWEMQMHYWQDYLNLWQQTLRTFAGEQSQPAPPPENKDRRFKDAAWHENIIFDFIKQSYLLTAEHIQHSVEKVEGLDPHTQQKIEFYTRQFVDALAPSNFLMTNPQVLRATLESGGENLVNGLERLLEDLKRGNGQLHISMTDEDAFAVGHNLAITPGQVVYQNELMQLIQYEPATEQVYKTPLLMIPAWINKYYVLDLRPENSFVKWATEQGFTVFMISWVNPDEKLTMKSFEDYLNLGPLAALEAIEKITGEKQVNTVGYCLGGTLLACLLAYLHGKGEADRICSATYLTTMIDFTDSGDLGVFIDEAQLQALESKMEKTGYLEGREMSTTFNLLRANDLIWSFVVNNYLLGKDPFPFDLLYWNADSTHMPAVMHSFYLRNMYLQNKLVEKGGITLNGIPLDMKSVKTPAFFLSTGEDHIAPWKSTYSTTQLFRGPVEFVLAGSGHIAGVINPPTKNKYGYHTAEKTPKSPESWLKSAAQHDGSWWPHWRKWETQFAGEKVPARKVKDGIEPAPGSYAKVRS